MVRPKKPYTTARRRVPTSFLGYINHIGDSMERIQRACLLEHVVEESDVDTSAENINAVLGYIKMHGVSATYNKLMVSILLADGHRADDLIVKAYKNDQGAIDRLKQIDADDMTVNPRLLAPLISSDADYLAALIELEVEFDKVMEIFENGK